MGTPHPKTKPTRVLNAHRAILASIRDAVLDRCGGDRRYAVLVSYLLSTTRFDREAGKRFAVLPRDVIAHAFGCRHPRQTNTEALLRGFCDHFDLHWGAEGDPSNDVLEHWHFDRGYTENKCRRIRIDFLSDLRASHWQALREPKLDWVDVATGKPTTFRRQAGIVPVSATQGEIIRFLRSNPHEIYEPTLEDRLNAMDAIDSEPEDDRARSQAELTRLLQSPPDYVPSERRMTNRVFDSTWSGLSSTKRDLLFPNEVELDLSTAYVAIFLKVFEDSLGPSAESARVRAKLTAGSDLFSTAPTTTPVPITPLRTGFFPEAEPAQGFRPTFSSLDAVVSRAIVKTLSYAIVFGMRDGVSLHSKGGAVKHLNDQGLNAEQIHEVLNLEIISDLMTMTKALRKHAKKCGFLVGLNGAKWELKRHDGRFESTLSMLSSAWEMELLAPATNVTNDIPGAYVKLWQHDGVRLTHLDPTCLEPFAQLVMLVVDEQAKRFGILTKLVVKRSKPVTPPPQEGTSTQQLERSHPQRTSHSVQSRSLLSAEGNLALPRVATAFPNWHSRDALHRNVEGRESGSS